MRDEELEPSVRIPEHGTHRPVHGETQRHVIRLGRVQHKWEHDGLHMLVHVIHMPLVRGMSEQLVQPLLPHDVYQQI